MNTRQQMAVPACQPMMLTTEPTSAPLSSSCTCPTRNAAASVTQAAAVARGEALTSATATATLTVTGSRYGLASVSKSWLDTASGSATRPAAVTATSTTSTQPGTVSRRSTSVISTALHANNTTYTAIASGTLA